MKRLAHLFTIVGLFFIDLQAQNPQYAWFNYTQRNQNNYSDLTKPVMCLDQEAHVVVGRCVRDSAFFKDFPYSPSKDLLSDIYIHKFDSTGKVLWAAAFAGIGDDYITDIESDKSSNIYITGYYSDSLLINGRYERNDSFKMNKYQMYLIKLSANGQFLWFKKLGVWHGNYYPTMPQPTAECDIYGNVWLMNRFFEQRIAVDTVSIYQASVCNSKSSVFLLQLDSHGTALQSAVIQGTVMQNIGPGYGHNRLPDFDFYINRNNQIFTCISFQSDTIVVDGTKIPDFDSSHWYLTQGRFNPNHLLVARLNDKLKLQSYGLLEGKFASITADNWDNIYLGGQFYLVTINGTTIRTNKTLYRDILMVKFNENCEPVRVFMDSTAQYYFYDQTPVEANNYITHIYVDANNNLLSQLQFVASWLKLPNGKYIRSASSGGQESYLLKLDSNFNITWMKYTEYLFNAVEDEANGKAYLASLQSYYKFDALLPNFGTKTHVTACIHYAGVNTTGTSDNSISKSLIRIHPNPANTQIIVQRKNGETGYFNLYSTQGQVILSKIIDSEEPEFNRIYTADVKDGVYYATFMGKTVQYKQMIVIQH